LGTVKKQKRARKEALKNRYFAGAKLSEHKFLRLLRGYAEGLTIQELAKTTHVSGKTIRATYRALRERLAEAAYAHPERFGGAANLLLHESANHLIHAVQRSPAFRRYRRHHAPRLSCPVEEQALATEKLVRLVYTLDLRGLDVDETVIEALANGITQLRPRDPLQKLAEFIPAAKPHAHPTMRLYEDYRRYLLKNPLGRSTTNEIFKGSPEQGYRQLPDVVAPKPRRPRTYKKRSETLVLER
jgi:hypothetical protein